MRLHPMELPQIMLNRGAGHPRSLGGVLQTPAALPITFVPRERKDQ
jgi:hypothetical protein